MVNPTTRPEWAALTAHKAATSDFSLRLALKDPVRFQDLSFALDGTLYDFSKNLITPETLKLLLSFARACGVESLRDRMFAGEKINTSENRAVLHTALRATPESVILADGENVMPFVTDVLSQMATFSNRIRSGQHTGYTGAPITDVVNIGIGGSDLGPRFVTDALRDFHDGPRVHFVSNVDGSVINRTLSGLKPETTLILIASKTFTTEETMLNAEVAKSWFLSSAPREAIGQHFAALSTNQAAVTAFGIHPDNMFPFKDWVGGRYSLWSAIGLPIMLAIGPERFHDLLEGARLMDAHFRQAPLERNIPALMGMIGVWHNNFYGYHAHMLLPYDDRLGKIAKFVQQMDMESNGKSVDRDGQTVSYATGPIIFGEPGTDSQHSFMQLVHQGTSPIPADFILAATPHHSLETNHISLTANFLAQTRALALGQTLDEAGGDPSRVFSGNRPSTSIILPELSPRTLGSLLAAYEHKVFVQGVLWNLNSFDQPGVELGKKLAKPLRGALETHEIPADLDSSTAGLMRFLHSPQ